MDESRLKIAGIAIDDWKLPIFHQFLTEAGYGYTQRKGIAPSTIFLTVSTEDLDALQKVVFAANAEAILIDQTGGCA